LPLLGAQSSNKILRTPFPLEMNLLTITDLRMEILMTQEIHSKNQTHLTHPTHLNLETRITGTIPTIRISKKMIT
jgi:hypothetical protein